MRPAVLGFLGAVAAKYLQAFKFYDDDIYDDGYYFSPYGGVYKRLSLENSKITNEFWFENNTIVGELGSLVVRDDGRVLIRDSDIDPDIDPDVDPDIDPDNDPANYSVISVEIFYGIHGGNTTGIYPTNLDGRRFYVCKDYRSGIYDGETYLLYYINPEEYWVEAGSTIDEGDMLTDSDTDILDDSNTDTTFGIDFSSALKDTLGSEDPNKVDTTPPLITKAPEKSAIHRVRHKEELSSLFKVKKRHCEPVQLGLVPKGSVCTDSDDPGCTCVTQCILASCLPGLLCPPRECTTRCRPDACYTVNTDTICSGTSCKYGGSDYKCCKTFYATDRGVAPKWTVLCPGNKCFDVCRPCNSLGCLALCTSSCLRGISINDLGASITESEAGIIYVTEPGLTIAGCRYSGCSCQTCPWVNVVTGCPTCKYTFTDYVFTCPLVTTMTFETCGLHLYRCSSKTVTFLPGTHTILGTAVLRVKSDVIQTITPRGTTEVSDSDSTTAGNDASRNTLVSTFVSAILLGFLMW